jgi:hypothetical protein
MPTKDETKLCNFGYRELAFGTNNPNVLTVLTDNTLFTRPRNRTFDSQVPGWRHRLANGDYCTTRFVGNDYDDTLERGYAEWSYDRVDLGPGVREGGSFDGFILRPSSYASSSFDYASLTSQADNLALKNYVSNVKKMQQELNALVDLGEIRETINLFKHPYRSIRRLLDDYRRHARRIRRRRASNGSKLRAIGDTWLETSFGLMPLFGSVEDAAKALATISEAALQPWRMCRGFALSEQETTETQSNPTSVYGGAVMKLDVRKNHSVLIKYYGVVDLTLSADGRKLASQNFGFTIQNFVPTLYELIPFSFLLDYFTNVGDMIEAWAFFDSHLRWTVRTVKQMRETTVASARLDVSNINAPNKTTFVRPGQTRFGTYSVSREKYLGSLVPDFQVELPGVRSDALKWLNMAALCSARVRW